MPDRDPLQSSLLEKGSAAADSGEEVLSELEKESADYFSSFAQMMGFPKSVGQIYGLLFMSVEPLPMDEVVTRLNISKGSASQGLSLLKGFGAVKSLRLDGDRREHFAADFDVSRMIHHFVEEKMEPRIQNGEERLVKMEGLVSDLPSHFSSKQIAAGRLNALRKWQNRGKNLLPLIRKFFKKI
ncbi:MAG: hypothetical protein MI807_23200 [Verrucomicrobiales bacterium]|nr:hypothetical protein [Verrucomicrobiales bacterium]